MGKPVDLDFLLRFFRLTEEADDHESWWWRTDGEYAPVTIWVNCNDLFDWGCADCEEVTPENLDVLEGAIRDLRALDQENVPIVYASSLFAARVRGERPQRACYKHYPPEVAVLFDACGPEREINLANPCPNEPKKVA